jgi:hypothetical protein
MLLEKRFKWPKAYPAAMAWTNGALSGRLRIDLKLVDLIGEIADEDRGCRGLACSRFDTGVRHAIQQIETLAPSANEPA